MIRTRQVLSGKLAKEAINSAEISWPSGRVFAPFFADRGSDNGTARAPQVIAATLGITGPVAIGALTGHAEFGMIASLGGLALSSDGKGKAFRERARGLIYTIAAGSAAMLTGAVLAGQGMRSAICIPAVAAVAGLIGGISRPLAQAMTRFILYTIIAANLGIRGVHPLGVMLLFFLGASWTAGLSLALTQLLQTIRPAPISRTPAGAAPPTRPSAAQLFHRWRKSLTHLSGWQYVLRIVPCLFAGQAFDCLWPYHHSYWVSITVIIVVQRDLRVALPRALQRATGTTIGVLLTGLLLLGSSSMWAAIAMIAVLSTARPILKEANYTAYAAVMTPLVILLLDFGREPSWAVVVDRLAATFAGCTLAVTFGYLMWSRIHPPARTAVKG